MQTVIALVMVATSICFQDRMRVVLSGLDAQAYHGVVADTMSRLGSATLACRIHHTHFKIDRRQALCAPINDIVGEVTSQFHSELAFEELADVVGGVWAQGAGSLGDVSEKDCDLVLAEDRQVQREAFREGLLERVRLPQLQLVYIERAKMLQWGPRNGWAISMLVPERLLAPLPVEGANLYEYRTSSEHCRVMECDHAASCLTSRFVVNGIDASSLRVVEVGIPAPHIPYGCYISFSPADGSYGRYKYSAGTGGPAWVGHAIRISWSENAAVIDSAVIGDLEWSYLHTKLLVHTSPETVLHDVRVRESKISKRRTEWPEEIFSYLAEQSPIITPKK